MIAARGRATVLAALAATAALALAAPSAAAAGLLVPARGQTFFGLTDSGVSSQFDEFAEAVGKHPAVIETFTSWGADLRTAVKHWENALARPVIHISTASPSDGHEIITPRQIALGFGDEYLLALNHLFSSREMRAYVRPLGEPNRCLNVYAAYDCAGGSSGSEQSPAWYRRAFRRIYILLHGGGTLEKIDQMLAEAGLPPVRVSHGEPPAGLAQAPVAVIWSPLPDGSPEIRRNLPEHFFPGRAYVDWIGTDFYSAYANWKSLNRFYTRFTGKPFSITEWGINGIDDPVFVRRLFTWAQRHARCRMLIYYQDFGAASAYRLQNYPASLAVVRNRLASPSFPPYAFDPPQPPPPPPGGVSS